MTYWNIVWSMPMFTVPDLVRALVLSITFVLALAVYHTHITLILT